jgi:putative transposase
VTKVNEVGERLGIAATCAAVGLPRATYYRRRGQPKPKPSRRPAPPRKLPAAERERVLAVLHEERFADWAPAQVHAQLLDEGVYLCSARTMHRILAENAEVRERRNQLRHPRYEKPQLLATRPNELWSWDITKLLGPEKWTYYYLYVVLDVFSRYATGWLIAERESGELARQLMRETCERQGIEPDELTVHSDRGGPMKSKTLAQLYADLGVTKTHSRPHTSNDNPFSESQFKTVKYRPEFPRRFGSLEHARDCSRDLIDWYNNEHHHSSLAFLTPHDVHHGLAERRLAERASVLEAAYRDHPERFVQGPPKSPTLARAVWINPPTDTSTVDAHGPGEEEKNEAGHQGPAPSVLPPTRRSGCSSAEPYPPSGQTNARPKPAACNAASYPGLPASESHPDCLSSDKPRGLGQSPITQESAPLAALH